MGDLWEKPHDHPQAELGLSHMWPELGLNQKFWTSEKNCCISSKIKTRGPLAHLSAEDMLKSAVIDKKKFKNIESEWFGLRPMNDRDFGTHKALI